MERMIRRVKGTARIVIASVIPMVLSVVIGQDAPVAEEGGVMTDREKKRHPKTIPPVNKGPMVLAGRREEILFVDDGCIIPVEMGDNANIRFNVDGGWIDVKIENGDIVVMGERSLSILPSVSNSIVLSLSRHRQKKETIADPEDYFEDVSNCKNCGEIIREEEDGWVHSFTDCSTCHP